MIEETPSHLSGQGPVFQGLEVGSVSVKWVRRSPDGATIRDVRRHGGDPAGSEREEEGFRRSVGGVTPFCSDNKES